MSKHHPSPLWAAAASATLPGWGQLRAGRRRLGAALTAASLTLLAASVAALASEGLPGVIAWLLDPGFLLVLLVANLVLGLVRGWATVHAWRAAGGRLTSALIGALLLLVVVPHVALGYYGLETRSALITVFAEGSEEEETTTTTTSTTTTIARAGSSSTSVVRVVVSSPDPAVTTNPAPGIVGEEEPSPLGERFTVLLLGGDAGPGRHGLRTDTVMVASIDTADGDAALFGLPRNMGGFTFSDGSAFPGLSRGLLNEVYQWGWRHPERFPGRDPGAEAVRDVAAHLLGIPIDHYVLAEMVGFAEVVDALGGVVVEVARPVEAPLYHRDTGGYTMITIPPGSQRMDGDLALAYSRSRTGSNDYDRMARQRCLLSALGSQLDPIAVFAGFADLLEALERSVRTDLPLSKVPFLVNLAPLLDRERIVVVGLDRGYRAGYTPDGLGIPDVEVIRSTVETVLAGDYLAAELPTAGESCG